MPLQSNITQINMIILHVSSGMLRLLDCDFVKAATYLKHHELYGIPKDTCKKVI